MHFFGVGDRVVIGVGFRYVQIVCRVVIIICGVIFVFVGNCVMYVIVVHFYVQIVVVLVVIFVGLAYFYYVGDVDEDGVNCGWGFFVIEVFGVFFNVFFCVDVFFI